MTAAIVILSIFLIVAIVVAVGLGYHAGELRGDLAIAQGASSTAIDAADDCEGFAAERIERKDLVISDLRAKLRDIRDELQEHPDPTVRGSAALNSVVGLLSEMQNFHDTSPGRPHNAGRMPTEE